MKRTVVDLSFSFFIGFIVAGDNGPIIAERQQQEGTDSYAISIRYRRGTAERIIFMEHCMIVNKWCTNW